MAEILHLFQAIAHGQPMHPCEQVSAIENKGFQDCSHGRRGSKRQVLVMDIETLEEFGIAAGEVKENITTRGISLDGLAAGQQLRAGEALLEVTTPCQPCDSLEKIRQGLKSSMSGRRGILCRVLRSGTVRRGDPIEIIETLPQATGMPIKGSG